MNKRIQSAIEKIIAACDGDLHGALRALMLVNEHLDGELEAIYASVEAGWLSAPGVKHSLH